MKRVLAFNKPFRSTNVITEMGEVLVSEGAEIKLRTVNELTGESNDVEGTVLKLAAKKMEIESPDFPYPMLVKFSEVQAIEIIL